MSLDLVAVQRDAALLDELAQRVHPADLDAGHQADPVVGLLAALVSSVDEGLADVAVRPAGSTLVPEQSRRGARVTMTSSLPVVLAPVGRRHVVRAVAAMVVTVALLSVSGVAAAVSGDPLTPYKVVFDVVRGHGDAVPKSLPAAAATRAAAEARAAAGAVVSPLAGERGAVAPRASRSRDRHHFWDGRAGDRAGWDRTGWVHGVPVRGGGARDGWASDGWGGQGPSSRGWDGRQRHRDDAGGRHRDGQGSGRAGGRDSGGDQAGSGGSRR
jgi:hypothetical protein